MQETLFLWNQYEQWIQWNEFILQSPWIPKHNMYDTIQKLSVVVNIFTLSLTET